MQARQGSKAGNAADIEQPNAADVQTLLLTTATTQLPDTEMYDPIFEPIHADWIQQMHDCERLGWRGGDEFYDGPHDNFCFVCGSSMGLFACQTCENCYHAKCMTPSLDPNDVPNFWFCPHCVDRELHIPPSQTGSNHFTPKSPVAPIYLSPTSLALSPEKQPSATEHLVAGDSATNNLETERLGGQEIARDSMVELPSQTFHRDNASKPAAESRSKPESTDIDTRQGRINQSRSKRVTSPPRKKSKYSNFSIEVDKALAVLYSELETAAQCGKSEGNLESKIRDLEQKLKLQDGQLKLSNRELESVRGQLTMERAASDPLERENAELRDEIFKLREMVQQKDGELRDWRMKLRTMIGSELE